jgi:hypothetical protein
MGIKKENQVVYTCSNGSIFTDENDAKEHEFDTGFKPGSLNTNPDRVRKWLINNKNFVLDYIGTEYDPEAG